MMWEAFWGLLLNVMGRCNGFFLLAGDMVWRVGFSRGIFFTAFGTGIWYWVFATMRYDIDGLTLIFDQGFKCSG